MSICAEVIYNKYSPVYQLEEYLPSQSVWLGRMENGTRNFRAKAIFKRLNYGLVGVVRRRCVHYAKSDIPT